MSLVEWNPLREINNMSRDLGGFFDQNPIRFFGNANFPRADVYQTETDVIIKAEIPRVTREDLNVYADENSIRLSGQSRKSNEFKDENIYRAERYYGSFSRTIPLPVEIKSDEARAEYRDGILTIKAPKVEPSKARGKKLDIQ